MSNNTTDNNDKIVDAESPASEVVTEAVQDAGDFPPEVPAPPEEAIENDMVENHQITVDDTNDTSKTISITTSKNTLAPRPWQLGAIQVPVRLENGETRDGWVAAVIDANGKAICCGDTPDMEFIIKLENSYDNILKLLNTSGSAIADAVEVLRDFECKKTKAFKFN